VTGDRLAVWVAGSASCETESHLLVIGTFNNHDKDELTITTDIGRCTGKHIVPQIHGTYHPA
jgi:hypothetical protein